MSSIKEIYSNFEFISKLKSQLIILIDENLKIMKKLNMNLDNHRFYKTMDIENIDKLDIHLSAFDWCDDKYFITTIPKINTEQKDDNDEKPKDEKKTSSDSEDNGENPKKDDKFLKSNLKYMPIYEEEVRNIYNSFHDDKFFNDKINNLVVRWINIQFDYYVTTKILSLPDNKKSIAFREKLPIKTDDMIVYETFPSHLSDDRNMRVISMVKLVSQEDKLKKYLVDTLSKYTTKEFSVYKMMNVPDGIKVEIILNNDLRSAIDDKNHPIHSEIHPTFGQLTSLIIPPQPFRFILPKND